MAYSKQEIIDAIEEHISNCGGGYRAWYVGISNNARCRLFEDHRVNEKNDAWIYRTAISSEVARDVELFFTEIRGTDGGTGGGDSTTNMVYAYKKTLHTNHK